jgi:hypothetical protein
MSFTITTAFVKQFEANMRMLAQQKMARLRPAVDETTIKGDEAYFDQIGATEARERESRHAATPIMSTPHTRRRAVPIGIDWGDVIDKLDKVQLLIDPASSYAQAGAAALNRKIDSVIIAAFFGTAYTGKNGTVANTWPNGNAETSPAQAAGTQVAVSDWTYGAGSGNAGLTISKLISAKTALAAAEGDEDEELYIAVPATKIADLLATTEATSADFNKSEAMALVEGRIDKFMGFNFIRTERLTKNVSGQWRIPAWRKSGMMFGVAQDIEGEVSQRPDLSFATQVYASMSVGASRMQESFIAEIIATV